MARVPGPRLPCSMDSKQFRSKELPIEAALRSTSGEGLSSVDATVCCAFWAEKKNNCRTLS